VNDKWYEGYQKIVYRHLKCVRDQEFYKKLAEIVEVILLKY